MEYSFCFSLREGGGSWVRVRHGKLLFVSPFLFGARTYCPCPFFFDCSTSATTLSTVLFHRPDSQYGQSIHVAVFQS